jgi:hypothetical protein
MTSKADKPRLRALLREQVDCIGVWSIALEIRSLEPKAGQDGRWVTPWTILRNVRVDLRELTHVDGPRTWYCVLGLTENVDMRDCVELGRIWSRWERSIDGNSPATPEETARRFLHEIGCEGLLAPSKREPSERIDEVSFDTLRYRMTQRERDLAEKAEVQS